jgi:hypothetical protein
MDFLFELPDPVERPNIEKPVQKKEPAKPVQEETLTIPGTPEPLDDVEEVAQQEVLHLILQVNDFLTLSRKAESEEERIEHLEDAIWIYEEAPHHIHYNITKTIKEYDYSEKEYLKKCQAVVADVLEAGIEVAITRMKAMVKENKLKEAATYYYDLREEVYDTIAEAVTDPHTHPDLHKKVRSVVRKIEKLL